MPDSLPVLETQRTAIQRQIAQLGDMRAGSITMTGGRCGNPRCHCHEKDDPGHGPFYRLTRKVNGKTVTETFSIPAALRKAQDEIAAYRIRQTNHIFPGGRGFDAVVAWTNNDRGQGAGGPARRRTELQPHMKLVGSARQNSANSAALR